MAETHAVHLCSDLLCGNQQILKENLFLAAGESTLTDALTSAGKTYEEIAQLVAEQVGLD